MTYFFWTGTRRSVIVFGYVSRARFFAGFCLFKSNRDRKVFYLQVQVTQVLQSERLRGQLISFQLIDLADRRGSSGPGDTTYALMWCMPHFVKKPQRTSRQTNFQRMLIWCWASGCDAGPTSNHHTDVCEFFLTGAWQHVKNYHLKQISPTISAFATGVFFSSRYAFWHSV